MPDVTLQVEMTTILFNSCVTACDKGGQWQYALEVMEAMHAANVERELITYNSCLSACGKAHASSARGTVDHSTCSKESRKIDSL